MCIQNEICSKHWVKWTIGGCILLMMCYVAQFRFDNIQEDQGKFIIKKWTHQSERISFFKASDQDFSRPLLRYRFHRHFPQQSKNSVVYLEETYFDHQVLDDTHQRDESLSRILETNSETTSTSRTMTFLPFMFCSDFCINSVHRSV